MRERHRKVVHLSGFAFAQFSYRNSDRWGSEWRWFPWRCPLSSLLCSFSSFCPPHRAQSWNPAGFSTPPILSSGQPGPTALSPFRITVFKAKVIVSMLARKTIYKAPSVLTSIQICAMFRIRTPPQGIIMTVHRQHLASARHIETSAQQLSGIWLSSHSMPASKCASSSLWDNNPFCLSSNLENLAWNAFMPLHNTQILLQWQAYLPGKHSLRKHTGHHRVPAWELKWDVCSQKPSLRHLSQCIDLLVSP